MPNNTPTSPDNFWPRVDQSAGPEGCWPWIGAIDPRRYGTVNYKGRTRRTHRIAYLFGTGTEAVDHVLHTCDNPPCCNPAHLYDGTHQQNMDDRTARNRTARGVEFGDLLRGPRPVQQGQRHHGARLSDDDARVIRGLAGQESQRSVAERYGVSQSTISHIQTGRKWRYVV